MRHLLAGPAEEGWDILGHSGFVVDYSFESYLSHIDRKDGLHTPPNTKKRARSRYALFMQMAASGTTNVWVEEGRKACLRVVIVEYEDMNRTPINDVNSYCYDCKVRLLCFNTSCQRK